MAHCVGETISIHSTLSTERISSMALGRYCLRRGGGSKALWVAKACSSSESLPEVDRWSSGAFRHLFTRTLCLGCEGPSITVLSTYPAIESLISFPTRLSTRLRRNGGTGFSLKWTSTLRHRVGSARSSAPERNLVMCRSWWTRSAL